MREIKPFDTHHQFAKLIAELLKGQGTRYGLADRAEMHRNTVSRILIALKEQGCVHIVGWERDTTGRQQQAVFTLGGGEDAPRPPRQTQAQRDAKRYRKIKEMRLSTQMQQIRTQFAGANPWLN